VPPTSHGGTPGPSRDVLSVVRGAPSSRRRTALALAGVLGLGLVGAAVAARSGVAPVDWGAAAILRPMRRPVTVTPQVPYETVAISSGDVRLEGWLFRPADDPRGFGRELVVYLHGIADNRASGLGLARRLRADGFAVLVFDARAHGRSTGDYCTYGYYERRDVGAALDAVGARRAVLIGHSLGASTALQAAAVDDRVTAVVAASPFSDLESIVRERARWFLLPRPYVDAALARAGEMARFAPQDASPVALAPRVRAPVLLLHGAADAKTPMAHSERIAAALASPHELVLLPGVGHDEILGREEAWRAIDAFLLEYAPPRPRVP
jgi:dipeptidyl aminopeptidase/acylaminoacyl peptidase